MGICDNCYAQRSYAWWQMQMNNGMIGPSGQWHDAMCDACNFGNVCCIRWPSAQRPFDRCCCIKHKQLNAFQDTVAPCEPCELAAYGCCAGATGYTPDWIAKGKAFRMLVEEGNVLLMVAERRCAHAGGSTHDAARTVTARGERAASLPTPARGAPHSGRP